MEPEQRLKILEESMKIHNTLPLQNFFTIRFEHMFSLGSYRYKEFDCVRPGAYKYEVTFMFVCVEWGKI